MGTGPAIHCLAEVSSDDLASILIWSGVLVGLVIVLAIVMVMAKRHTASSRAQSTPFTLGELRKMRDAGQLSDEEFQRTRDQMVGMAKGDLGGESDTPSKQDERPLGGGTTQPEPGTPRPEEGNGADLGYGEDEDHERGEGGRGA